MNSRTSKFLLAALALSGAAVAQQKEALNGEMTELAKKASLAKIAGNQARYEALTRRVDAISARLGGDRPLAPAHAAPSAATPGALGGPLLAVQPADCTGSPLVTYPAVAGTTGPISDFVVGIFTANVSGVTNPVWDVDVFTNITHTYAADLDITVVSPLSTRVEITSDNGGANNDVFSNTLWDDQSANPVTTYVFTDLVPAPDLRPENPLNGGFRGESANGVWTLEVYDDAGADVGNVNAWSITITDGNVNPPPPPPVGGPHVTFSSSPGLPIVDFAQTIDTINVSGVGTLLADVDLYVEITHTFNGDLAISLTSPAGETAIASDRRGGGNDDVFNGTLFDDSSTNPIATYAFSNGVVAPDLQPEQSFAVLVTVCGIDPNGLWTLTVEDFAGADQGTLNRWDLKISSASGNCGPVVNYCTPASTTNGCTPLITASSANASIGAGPGSFVLTTNGVEGQKSGLIFYGISGRNSLPWAAGSSSFLCVKAPTQRMQAQSSGGTAGQCNGSLVQDFFQYTQVLNPFALGSPQTPGQVYDAQAWFRDPPAAKTTNLSNGIEFTLCP
jgi:subtilisin-like proprotein convertase family protein